MRFIALLIATLSLVLTPSGARAEWFELRGGVIAPADPALLSSTPIAEANVELLVEVFPLTLLSLLGSFRPHIGADISLTGGPQTLYSGLSWTFSVPGLPIFVEASLGAALRDTALADAMAGGGFDASCLGFVRGSASLGYDVLANVRVMLTLDHARRVGGCAINAEGITKLGARVGVHF